MHTYNILSVVKNTFYSSSFYYVTFYNCFLTIFHQTPNINLIVTLFFVCFYNKIMTFLPVILTFFKFWGILTFSPFAPYYFTYFFNNFHNKFSTFTYFINISTYLSTFIHDLFHVKHFFL